MTSNGRVARLTALALATGTLVAAGAGSAGAATATKTSYTATGGGNVATLTLNLPLDIPGVGSVVTENLISTGSAASTSGVGSAPQAISNAAIGQNGAPALLAGLLDQHITAEYGKNSSAQGPTHLPENPLISGGVLDMIAKVANPDLVSSTPAALGKTAIVDLKIGDPANLTAALNQIVAILQTQLQGLIGTTASGSAATPVAGVTTTVKELLNTLATQLPALPVVQDAPQKVQDTVDQVATMLNQLPQQLASALSAKLTAAAEDHALLEVGLLRSTQTITHNASAVTSLATNELAHVSALGGLVSVDSLSSKATATLGNGVSDASATGVSTPLQLGIADILQLTIDENLTPTVKGILPPEVLSAVNGALAQVTTALTDALGAKLVPGKTGPLVKASDKASATENPATLVIQPMGFAKPLVQLALVPASAKVVKAQAQIKPVLTPGKAAAGDDTLARTGANLPLTGAVAAALLGLAAVVRRRRAGLAE